MKTLIFIILAVVVLCRAQCNTATFMSGKYPRCATLNTEYDMYWSISGEDITIALNLRGYTNPWLGLGISINGGMMGSDIALSRYENGKYILEDRFGTEFAEPVKDTLQNLQLISATSSNQNTIIEYKRKLIPCDVDEDYPINENSTQVIFAYGTGSFSQHSAEHRGTVILFFHFVPQVQPLPTQHTVLNITMPPYAMPPKDTTYTCVSSILPRDQKYHIVRWRPIVQNPKYVHHIVLFGCYTDPNTTIPYECGMAPANCGNVVIAWSIGQNGDDFLGDFALPIGNTTTTGVFVVLQIHYNNPTSDTGVVDGSGIQIIYTPELRRYDVGTVPMTTPTSILVLPPGQKEIYHYSRCHSECTAKSIPDTGYTIINWFPHMHQLGSRIWLSHIRNGVELPEIFRDDHYDFERQQNFPVYRTIYPGDSLILHCIWDTSTVTTNVIGGESSSQEMCVAIFQYFPASSPPIFTRCTDLHEYLNTTGNNPGYATCTSNNATAINPITNRNFSGGVTPVITNPTYTPYPKAKTTCPPQTTFIPTTNSSPKETVLSIVASLLIVVVFML